MPDKLPPLKMGLVGRTIIIEENKQTGEFILRSQNILKDVGGTVEQTVAFSAKVLDTPGGTIRQTLDTLIYIVDSQIPRLEPVTEVASDDEAAKRIEAALKEE